MAKVINLQPQVLDLGLYAGDGVKFRLVCTDGAGDPLDITGQVKAQIRINRTDQSSPLAEFTVGLVDAYQGIVVLSLTGDQTSDLVQNGSAGKFAGVWDVQWSPANEEPRTLIQGKVDCVSDVTR